MSSPRQLEASGGFRILKLGAGLGLTLPLLLLSPSLLPLPFHSLPFPPLFFPLEVGPLNPARESGGAQ